MAVTKFYIDDSSPAKYVGGFSEGNALIDTVNWIEISAPPPVHADQTTTDGGATWSTYP